MASKITEKEILVGLKNGEIAPTDEVAQEFFERKIATIDKRAESKKPTKTQVENEELKDVLFDVLSTLGKPATVSEIIKSDERLEGKTTQKISPLLNAMVKSEVLVKIVDKKSSLFSIPE